MISIFKFVLISFIFFCLLRFIRNYFFFVSLISSDFVSNRVSLEPGCEVSGWFGVGICNEDVESRFEVVVEEDIVESIGVEGIVDTEVDAEDAVEGIEEEEGGVEEEGVEVCVCCKVKVRIVVFRIACICLTG